MPQSAAFLRRSGAPIRKLNFRARAVQELDYPLDCPVLGTPDCWSRDDAVVRGVFRPLHAAREYIVIELELGICFRL